MNTEIKRHIDSARQVLVGVVPNPTSQIDQITTALIYKFMDDMDQSAIKVGGDPSFFTSELEKYSWTKLMDTRIGNQERMNLYVEALSHFAESKKLPELFRGIFKSAFLPYRSPDTLGLFLKEINYFDYSHPEDLGDAYEYLLSIMSSQGDAGQFRTPRHIIDFMVDVVDPGKDDRILDPACGTAGFLIKSYLHILEKHDGKDDPEHKEKPLTPDERRKLLDNLEGYDIDPGMVRIAQVNMYLHQFKNPKIYQYDTLTQEDRWNDKFDVILANPPFMSPKGGIKPHQKFSIQSSRSEVLFVDYIMNHLKPRGRAAIIVPEGIIFQSGTAYKQLRKNLVDDGLYGVVSLPSGIFNPYAGVKTSILLFNNEIAKQKKEIVFVKVENDGYDLGATKRQIDKNDLPQALDILDKWKTGEKVESKLVTYVEKSKIIETGDYNLSGDRYRVATDYTNAKWPMVKLGEVITLNFGERITKNQHQGTKYPVYGGGGASFRTDEYNRENEYVVARFAMSEHCVRYVADKFWLLDSGGSILINPMYKELIYKNFIGKMLSYREKDIYACARGGAQKNLNSEHFYELKIPLPPLEIQEQIVKEIDGYQKVIDGAKQVIENWKAQIKIDNQWQVKKFGDLVNITTGKLNANASNENGEYPFFTCSKQVYKISSYSFDTEALLLSGNNASADYDVKYYKGKFDAYQRTYVITIKNSEEVRYKYLQVILEQKLPELKAKSIGNLTKYLTLGVIQNLEIPIAPISLQDDIIVNIALERKLVEMNKELIKIYEQKKQKTIDDLWQLQ